jgi:hypothetical protein
MGRRDVGTDLRETDRGVCPGRTKEKQQHPRMEPSTFGIESRSPNHARIVLENQFLWECQTNSLHDYVVLDRHTHNTFTGTTILL